MENQIEENKNKKVRKPVEKGNDPEYIERF